LVICWDLHEVKTVNKFLQKIREDEPQSIDSLNLELFAEMHERENGSRILHKLNQIKVNKCFIRFWVLKGTKQLRDIPLSHRISQL
jgi:hypothetical protein